MVKAVAASIDIVNIQKLLSIGFVFCHANQAAIIKMAL